MDNIKEAFNNVKKDISFLDQEIRYLNRDVSEIKEQLKDICFILEKLSEKPSYNTSQNLDTSLDRQTNQQTDRHINPTYYSNFKTYNSDFKPLNAQNLVISTGNKGVSTDRQTNQQTDRQTENPLENASKMLNSLDSIKKELRLKFKRLTEQEILIFSTIYQLEEEKGEADYKSLSNKLNLSESSIRDYVGRLIKKGIPLEKKKENNKNIKIFISSNLKKIASLSTILKLREI